jgi:hypothetical protein
LPEPAAEGVLLDIMRQALKNKVLYCPCACALSPVGRHRRA